MQQGAPAIVIRRPALALVFRHQGLVFDIENSCGIVGPLQESAQANEAQRFVLQHGADGDAPRQVRAILYPLEEGIDAGLFHRHGRKAAHLEPAGIGGLPQFAGQRTAHRMRVLAGGAQAASDARGVGVVEDHVAQHRIGRYRSVALSKVLVERHDLQQRHPLIVGLGARLREQGHAIVHLEHACEVLGPFHVTGHPEKMIGSSAQHVFFLRPPAPMCPWCHHPGTN